MKYAGILAVMLNVGLASVYAQQTPVNVNMSFSGTAAASTIDLKQPNTNTGQEDLAGKGTLGQFTFRVIKASANDPQPTSTCAGLYFQTVTGGGIFRFQDGSLLYVTLTGGGDCIDLVHMLAHCTWTFKINGGTGRFSNAQGTLKLTETAGPVLLDALGNPVYFAATGQITGTVWGVIGAQGQDGGQ